jgi:hypothetical protein
MREVFRCSVTIRIYLFKNLSLTVPKCNAAALQYDPAAEKIKFLYISPFLFPGLWSGRNGNIAP